MFLGLDLGTTNVKAVVVDRQGQPLAHAALPIALHYRDDQGVEQDIDEIWSAVLEVVRRVCGMVDAGQIEAIGVSSQGGALQVLDPHGRPVGHVISWLDPRGRRFDETATHQWGRSWLRQHLYRGCAGLAIGQLLRIREQCPAWLGEDHRIGFVGDIIVSRLCGRAAHDGTSCGLTMLYNPEQQELRSGTVVVAGRVGGAVARLAARTRGGWRSACDGQCGRRAFRSASPSRRPCTISTRPRSVPGPLKTGP